jgi:hypothetical protein
MADWRSALADWTAIKLSVRWSGSIGIRQSEVGNANKEAHLGELVKIVNGFSAPTASYLRRLRGK